MSRAAACRKKADALIANLRKHALDNGRFICGFDDTGRKVGPGSGPDAQFFLNMQTWAVLCGAAPDRNALLDLVERELGTSCGLVLCKPAVRAPDPRIGMITGMVPGNCENGSVYCHGNAFKIVADCLLGRAEEAYATLKKNLPGNPTNPDSGVEPYAVTNQYLGPENPHRAGAANGTWITGTAGWIYRAVTEHLLGLQPDYIGLRLRPCMPAAWPEVQIRRLYRDNIYNITLCRSSLCEARILRATGQARLIVDGKEISGDLLPLGPNGTEHAVTLSA
jgi:cellobiose phosphorylase